MEGRCSYPTHIFDTAPDAPYRAEGFRPNTDVADHYTYDGNQ